MSNSNQAPLWHSPGYGEAPEVVPGNAPEVQVGQGSELVSGQEDSDKHQADAAFGLDHNQSSGRVASTDNGKSQEEKDQTETNKFLNVCSGDLCPKTISMVADGSDLWLFARTRDNQIISRYHNRKGWSKTLELNRLPDVAISQPTAGLWHVNSTILRMDIFVVTKTRRQAYEIYASDTERFGEWKDAGSNVGTGMSFCKVGPNQMHVWTATDDTHEIYHTFWRQKEENIDKDALESNYTSEMVELQNNGGMWQREYRDGRALGFASSAVACLSRDLGDVVHDLFWYDAKDKALHYSNYNWLVGWSESLTWDGNFTGDPTAVSFTNERWDFFGVQADLTLHQTTWTKGDSGKKPLQSLGGSIQSVPDIQTLDNRTMDIIALGTTGTLHHLHFDGDKWDRDWEDLEILAHSAPSMKVVGHRVFILFLLKDGSMVVLTRNASIVSPRWKGSFQSKNLGGNFSFEYITPDSVP